MTLFLSVWTIVSSSIVLGLAIRSAQRRSKGYVYVNDKLERASPMLGSVIIGLVVGLIAALGVSLW